MYVVQKVEHAADGEIAVRAFVEHAATALQSAGVMQSRSGVMYSERTIGITVDDTFLQSSTHALLSKPGMHAAFFAQVRLQ